MAKAILVKQTKSTSQVSSAQKKILGSLGLRGIGTGIYRSDTCALRGMVNQVQHLVSAEQTEKSKSKRPASTKGQFKGYRLG